MNYYSKLLQFRENVAAWICFYNNKDLFKAFLERVLRLKEVTFMFLEFVTSKDIFSLFVYC